MRSRIAMGACVATVLLASGALAAEALKSGPQPGEQLTPFSPLNVNGRAAGEKVCQVWMNGNHPVAAVFARELDGNLTRLVKKIDQATAKYSNCKMGSWVVFLNDDEGLEKKLKNFIDKQGIKKTVLMIDNPSGPSDYNINKSADVTVVLYVDKTVKVNHAYRKGQLTSRDIDQIVAEVKKILPEDKQ